jgi:hypothetical protein
MTESNENLSRCLLLVAEQSGLGDWTKWTKRDFEQLSLLIEQKTRIMLSVSTLVRLYKGPTGRNPQKITLDALARYTGFDSWHAFCTCSDIIGPVKRPGQNFRVRKTVSRVLLPVGLLVLLTIGFFGFRALFSSRTIRPEDVRFKIINREITGLPATVQVEYDIGKYRPDSLLLQLYWNPDETIRLDPDQKHTSAIYCYPGVHTCKLIADQKVIGEQKVYIKTSGWTALIRNSGKQLIPLYIRNQDIISNGVLQVTEPMVNVRNLVPNSLILTSYYYVNDLGPIYGDDYIFTGRISVKPTTLGTQPCNYCSVYILGENGKHFFTIGDLGCSAYFKLGFSGEDDMKTKPNLTDFEYFTGGWTSFRSEVSGSRVAIFVGQSRIYSSDQVTNIGKIKGIHFIFSGLGAIDRVRLMNSRNFVAMDEDFERPVITQ